MIKSCTEPPVVQTRLQRWAQSVADRIDRLPVAARRALTIGTIAFSVLVGLLIITAPFDFYAQCAFAIGCFGAALILRRIPGRLTILIMICLSLTASLRYMYWRLTATLDFDEWIDIAFGYGLVLAELYA